MEKRQYEDQSGIGWKCLREREVYLPGAVMIAYGFWLSLTV